MIEFTDEELNALKVAVGLAVAMQQRAADNCAVLLQAMDAVPHEVVAGIASKISPKEWEEAKALVEAKKNAVN